MSRFDNSRFAQTTTTITVEDRELFNFQNLQFSKLPDKDTMPKDDTSNPPQRSVLYHCTCGNQLVLNPKVGGLCQTCGRNVSPKLLDEDLGVTVPLEVTHNHTDSTTGNSLSSDSFAVVPPVETEEQIEAENLCGSMFGHFQLVSPLGKGGVGQIYRAFDTSLKRYVAVKLLRSGIGEGAASSDKEVEKLLQEAISQARFTHPNIVTIYYVGQQNETPFLAMELVNGEPLSQRIESKSMAFVDLARVALDIVTALDYAFELDIIHGDIKPSNLLISKNGTAKLSDFGMARSASSNSDRLSGGTPNYISPELLSGELPSIQSDIYALGVTFYELTFGELPVSLNGTHIPDWIEAHKNKKLEFPTPWPQHIPEAWRAILQKMLSKDPADRYQSYDALLGEVKGIQPGSKIPARFFPRLIAAAIDTATVFSLAITLEVALGFSNFRLLGGDRSEMSLLFEICKFLPLLVYTFSIYFWRQSIGRNLMHLRVVNQHGLEPRGSSIALRSLLRMQFPWIFISVQLISSDAGTTAPLFQSILYTASLLLLMFDIIFMLFTTKSRSIHDMFFKTQVVLDTADLSKIGKKKQNLLRKR